MDELLYFNGIDAISGSYLLPPISANLFAKTLEGVELDPKETAELKSWYYAKTKANYGLKEGDPRDLAQSGWGVIFPAAGDPAVRAALKELLDWRQEQASRMHAHYYREFSGDDGYQPGETKLNWLARHGMGPGPADPENVPYYLLLVGDPETIPHRFQTQLDVQYASGRLDFDNLDDYVSYAHSVVEAEKHQLARSRTITFYGVSNPDDPATNRSSTDLVTPLAEDTARDHTDWQVQLLPPEKSTKTRLASLLGGTETPALLFTASHGAGFPSGHPLQKQKQGALITQDWPGPIQSTKPMSDDYFFSADDIASEARLFGMLAFFFACYGAGTPQMDEFAHIAFKNSPDQIAPQSFSAALPRRMLAHPKGSALAVIGHVDRAWGYSFYWGSAKRQLAVFESALNLLLKGFPVGAAVDPFYMRYAELSTELSQLLEDIQFGKKYEARDLAGMWTANNDARNYVILGDPAVRLMVAAPGVQPSDQIEITGPVQPSQVINAPPAETGLNTQLGSSDVLPPIQPNGRLYSVTKDDSYFLPSIDTIVIGRRDPASGSYPDIDLSIEGPNGASVSRRHAQITVEAKQLYIEDLNSTNFTQLNGKKLQPGQKYPLKNGDEIRLGSVLLVYLAL